MIDVEDGENPPVTEAASLPCCPRRALCACCFLSLKSPAGWNVTAATGVNNLAFDELIGFKPRHFEDMAHSLESIASRDLGKLLRQRGNILGRLIRRFLARWSVHFSP